MRVPTGARTAVLVVEVRARQLAAFSAAVRPVLLVLWSLAFGFALGHTRTWADVGEAAVFLAVGALVAVAERFYHRGHSGRIVGL